MTTTTTSIVSTILSRLRANPAVAHADLNYLVFAQ